jgi:hypothetical protein
MKEIYDSIPLPLLFNPLKHHLGFIREFIEINIEEAKLPDNTEIIKGLKHIGGSVMDIYTGGLTSIEICDELFCYLCTKNLNDKPAYASWAGTEPNDFKTIYLSDGSQWVMKYYNHKERYVHSFPARLSPLTFRIKANTLKSAILYQIFIGKDYITEEDLNISRAIAGLSPIKDIFDTQAITEMIEMLRS